MRARQMLQHVTHSGTADSTERGVPAWVLASLLVICVCSPYGLSEIGGGSLRLDHIAIPSVFATALALRRVRRVPPLAKALFAVLALALISSAFNSEWAMASPLATLKNVEGMARGPSVFVLAAAVAWTPRAERLLLRTMVGLAVLLAVISAVERAFPEGQLAANLAQWYGGPAYTTGVYADLGVNHKQLMLMVNRATAVFPTAPALGCAALVLLAPALMPGIPLTAIERTIMASASLAAGLASSSKSFAFGVPVLVLLASRRLARSRVGLFMTVFAVGGLVAAIWALNERTDDHIAGLLSALSRGDAGVELLTGGRFGNPDSEIGTASTTVLSESPLIGFGAGIRPGVAYSDSGLNRLLLHGGVLAVLFTFIGLVFEFRSLGRVGTPYALVARVVLGVAVALFIAIPVFLVPRLNDLAFAWIGFAYASARSVVSRARAAPSPGIPMLHRSSRAVGAEGS